MFYPHMLSVNIKKKNVALHVYGLLQSLTEILIS